MSNLAVSLSKLGRHGDALAMQERVLELHRRAIASSYSSLELHEEALAMQERVLEFMQQPQEDEEARQLRAAIALSRQEQERALKLYEMGFAKGVLFFYIN